MKKLIILILTNYLIMINFAYALNSNSAIKKYLSGRKLHSVEGIWKSSGGVTMAIHREGNSFYCKIINSQELISGREYCEVKKKSESKYSGTWYEHDIKLKFDVSPRNLNLTLSGMGMWGNKKSETSFSRIWPSNLKVYNSELGKPKKRKQVNIPKQTKPTSKKKKFKGFSFWDPTLCGAVYETDFGRKLGSACFKFNETKLRGSMGQAERLCMGELRSIANEQGVRNYSLEGCFAGY